MKLHTPKSGTIVAAGGALTGSYVTQGSVQAGQGRDQIVLLVAWTKGDETSLEVKIQFSDTYAFTVAYNDTVIETSAGVSTCYTHEYSMITASQNRVIMVSSEGMYWRIQAKATGGTPTGTIGILYRMDVIQK